MKQATITRKSPDEKNGKDWIASYRMNPLSQPKTYFPTSGKRNLVSFHVGIGWIP